MVAVALFPGDGRIRPAAHPGSRRGTCRFATTTATGPRGAGALRLRPCGLRWRALCSLVEKHLTKAIRREHGPVRVQAELDVRTMKPLHTTLELPLQRVKRLALESLHFLRDEDAYDAFDMFAE